MRRKAEQVPPTARMLRQYPSGTIWSVSVKTGSVEKHYRVITHPNSDHIHLETWRGRAIPVDACTKLLPVIRAAIARAIE